MLGRYFDLRIAAAGKRVLRILQQIVDHLPQTVGVAAHRGDTLLQVRLNPGSGLLVQGEHLRDQPVQIQPAELRRGRAGVVAEAIDHVLQRSHLRDDRLGGAVESLSLFEGKLVGELRLQALRGELDRREGILDLVGESARDLAPGGCALSRNQLRDVVEHHDVAAAARPGKGRAAHQNHRSTVAHLDLLLPFGAAVLTEFFPQHACKLGERRPILKPYSDEGREILLQYASSAAVCDSQDEPVIENEHPRREIGKNAFQIPLGGLELRLVALGGAARLAQLLSHAVERLGEDAQLVAARDRCAARKIASRHRLRALGEHGERLRQAPRQQERERDRGQQREQQRQGQRENVDLLQPLARQRQLLVGAIYALDRFALFGERLRHPVRKLKQARPSGELRAVQRHDHAQQKSFVPDGLDRAIAAHLPPFAQRLRSRGGRYESCGLAARARQNFSSLVQQQCFFDIGLLAQAGKRGGLLARRVLGEVERHHMGLEQQLVQHDVERRAAEIESTLERALDAHVEPRLDALREKLQRHGIDEQPGNDAHQGKHDEHPESEQRAEHLCPALPRQDRELVRHKPEERQGDRRVQAEQQRIVLGKERRVGRRRGKQEQQDAAERGAADQNVGHRASRTGASGVNGNRFQSEASVHSRLVTALTRNGVGSWAGSRRRRTEAMYFRPLSTWFCPSTGQP